jgi:DNA-binding NarL/FixJ family response regulator
MRSPDSRPIRILTVEDHLVVADALAALLDEQPDMDVTAWARSRRRSAWLLSSNRTS